MLNWFLPILTAKRFLKVRNCSLYDFCSTQCTFFLYIDLKLLHIRLDQYFPCENISLQILIGVTVRFISVNTLFNAKLLYSSLDTVTLFGLRSEYIRHYHFPIYCQFSLHRFNDSFFYRRDANWEETSALYYMFTCRDVYQITIDFTRHAESSCTPRGFVSDAWDRVKVTPSVQTISHL